MENVFFLIFSALALVSGVLVVLNPFSRNPVTSAMFLVVTMLSIAGLFVLLNAFFLAAVQVIVYAGAVIVLFLFVIMLLDLKEEESQRLHVVRVGLAGLGALALVMLGLEALQTLPASQAPGGLDVVGSAAALGNLLFTQYLLPFEVVSVLLLVAMIGVIYVSKSKDN